MLLGVSAQSPTLTGEADGNDITWTLTIPGPTSWETTTFYLIMQGEFTIDSVYSPDLALTEDPWNTYYYGPAYSIASGDSLVIEIYATGSEGVEAVLIVDVFTNGAFDYQLNSEVDIPENNPTTPTLTGSSDSNDQLSWTLAFPGPTSWDTLQLDLNSYDNYEVDDVSSWRTSYVISNDETDVYTAGSAVIYQGDTLYIIFAASPIYGWNFTLSVNITTDGSYFTTLEYEIDIDVTPTVPTISGSADDENKLTWTINFPGPTYWNTSSFDLSGDNFTITSVDGGDYSLTDESGNTYSGDSIEMFYSTDSLTIYVYADPVTGFQFTLTADVTINGVFFKTLEYEIDIDLDPTTPTITGSADSNDKLTWTIDVPGPTYWDSASFILSGDYFEITSVETSGYTVDIDDDGYYTVGAISLETEADSLTIYVYADPITGFTFNLNAEMEVNDAYFTTLAYEIILYVDPTEPSISGSADDEENLTWTISIPGPTF